MHPLNNTPSPALPSGAELRAREEARIPAGFFDGYGERLVASLPEQPWENSAHGEMPAVNVTFWGKVKPYVFMAAAFMGIWCMMNMFNLMKPADNIDSNPELLAALSDDTFVYDYFMPQSVADDGSIELLDAPF